MDQGKKEIMKKDRSKIEPANKIVRVENIGFSDMLIDDMET